MLNFMCVKTVYLYSVLSVLQLRKTNIIQNYRKKQGTFLGCQLDSCLKKGLC